MEKKTTKIDLTQLNNLNLKMGQPSSEIYKDFTRPIQEEYLKLVDSNENFENIFNQLEKKLKEYANNKKYFYPGKANTHLSFL